MGIKPLEQGEKIFSPSVPTKSSGTNVAISHKIAPDYFVVAENGLISPKKTDKVDRLIPFLYHHELKMRMSAVVEIVHMGPLAKKAGGALLGVLNNKREDEDLRELAAYGLGMIGYKKAFSTLTRIGTDKKEPYCVRSGALRGLADLKIATKKLIRDIRKILRKETGTDAAYLRMWAATNLKMSGLAAREAIPELVAVLKRKNESYFVTMEALLALGKMGSLAQPWMGLIIDHLKNGGIQERETAALTLGMLGGGKEVIRALSDTLTGDEWAQVRDAAALSLKYGNIDPSLIEVPISALADKRFNEQDIVIVYRAFTLLGSLDVFFRSAVDHLKKKVAEKSFNPSAQKLAEDILHRITKK